MVKRRMEVSSSTSELQLEQNMSNWKKSTESEKRTVKALAHDADSKKSTASHRDQKKGQHSIKDNSISSRTRAKTRQKCVLRSGKRWVQNNQKEAAETNSEAASYHHPYPTPNGHTEATPLTRSSAGRRRHSSTDLCQNVSAQTPSFSRQRHKHMDRKRSETNSGNRKSHSDSDSIIKIEKEDNDERGEDHGRDTGECVENGDEGVSGIKSEVVDCEDVDRGDAESESENGERDQQEGRCTCTSIWVCGCHQPSPAPNSSSSTWHLKVTRKRCMSGGDEDASSSKKRPAESPRMDTTPQTPESDHGSDHKSALVQDIFGILDLDLDRTAWLQSPSKVHSNPQLQLWLDTFKLWGNAERMMALDDLIKHCELPQVHHMRAILEPHFQRDFISLLPREVALHVLSFLKPKDLMRAAQTCSYWRMLCDDNLLWREKCQEEGTLSSSACARNQGSEMVDGCYKALYLEQSRIESNWRRGQLPPPMILKAHDDHVITCLEFCGQRIVSGSDDNTLKVWSAVTGKCLQTLVGHTGGVWSSQMSGNIVISGSTDRSLRVWNADTGECKHVLQGHTSTVRCMSLYGKKVVSGSRDATMRVWDIETGQCLNVLQGHVAAVRCVLYDGKYVVSGAYDYTVRVWNPETETCVHVLQGHTNRVYSLQFDGKHIVSGSLDTSIRVWNVETGACLHTLVGHQSLTSGLELKDNILVSGNADSTVKVWDITTGHCLQTLQGPNKHQSAVTCLQFNKKFVVTSSDDGTVKIWDLHTGEFLRNLVTLPSGGSGGVVWRLRCSNTQMVCAVGSRNGTEDTKLMVLNFEVDKEEES